MNDPVRTAISTAAQPRTWQRWALATLLTATGYFVAGWLALMLAIPPGYASPLYPGAGLALAAVLVYGRLALPGVLLGALPVQALLAATLLLALATVLVVRWDTERSRSVFERDAAAAAAALSAELQQSLFALEALRGLYIGSDEVTAAELHRVTQPWWQLPLNIQAMGYSERVARQVVDQHQAAVAKRLGRPFRLFDRETAGASSPTRGDADVGALTLIEPLAANQRALGVNVLSVSAAREALLRTVETDAPAATTGFQLTQESGNQTGVVLYHALCNGEPAAAARRQALRGVVFVTLRMQQSMAAAPAALKPRWPSAPPTCSARWPSANAPNRRCAKASSDSASSLTTRRSASSTPT